MTEIVRANEYHVREICRLWLEFMRYHQGINPLFEPCEGSVPGFEEEVRRVMRSEDGLVLTALSEGEVAGFSLSYIRGPHKAYKLDRYGSIDTMAVTERFRHQGVGEAMLEQTLRWFRSKGIDRVELEVLVGNVAGDSFWRKQGFTDCRHRLFRNI